MKAELFRGANLVLKAPDGSTPGEIYDLPAMRMQSGFLTQWRPSPEELVLLNAGAPVHLFVLGQSHAPVAVEVGALAQSGGLN